MIDISKLGYKTYILRETGELLNVTNISSKVDWEENEKELAMRLSLTLANGTYNGKRISSIVKPNCYVIVKADASGKSDEVARVKIADWQPTRTATGDELVVSGYDELYDIEKSQDNRYVRAGQMTRTIISGIFREWGIPLATYMGPNVSHAKTTFKNEYLSDIILELLDTAKKHSGMKYTVRASKGKVSILPRGSNTTIYCLEEGQNLDTTQYRIRTADMITVVKVVATDNGDDRQAVEAIIPGKIIYGRRQKIYVRDDDDSLATAMSAAKEILSENGEPVHTIKLKAPDVPYIRKGDKVKISARIYNGFAIVLSISHDASDKIMNLTVEKC